MTKAAELLKLTSLSVADIGNAVGYPNQLHFPEHLRMFMELRQEAGGMLISWNPINLLHTMDD